MADADADAAPAATSPRLLRLLQLADSALPAGGYAFSSGLESLARSGLLATLADLEDYLRDFMRQFCTGELPFVHSVYALGTPLVAAPEFRRMIGELNAVLTIPTMNRASRIQGGNYLRLLPTLFDDAGLRDLSDWFHTSGAPPHALIVQAAGLRTLDFSLAEALHLAYFVALRDQASAAVRLNLVGPLDAGRIQAQLLAASSSLAADVPRSYTEAYKPGPLIDVVQGRHDGLYTKLFQS